MTAAKDASTLDIEARIDADPVWQDHLLRLRELEERDRELPARIEAARVAVKAEQVTKEIRIRAKGGARPAGRPPLGVAAKELMALEELQLEVRLALAVERDMVTELRETIAKRFPLMDRRTVALTEQQDAATAVHRLLQQTVERWRVSDDRIEELRRIDFKLGDGRPVAWPDGVLPLIPGHYAGERPLFDYIVAAILDIARDWERGWSCHRHWPRNPGNRAAKADYQNRLRAAADEFAGERAVRAAKTDLAVAVQTAQARTQGLNRESDEYVTARIEQQLSIQRAEQHLWAVVAANAGLDQQSEWYPRDASAAF